MKTTTHNEKNIHFTFHKKNEWPRNTLYYPLKQLVSVTYYYYANKVRLKYYA